MITPGALGASGAVRPFYNRQPAGGPIETIVYTPLGFNQDAVDVGPFFIQTLVSPAFTLNVDDTLLCALCYNNQANVDALTVQLNGVDLNGLVARTFNTGADWIGQILYLPKGTLRVGSVIADFSASTGFPTRASILIAKVAGLIPGVSPNRFKAAFGSSGTQDSGLTILTNVTPHQFVWGAIACQGSVGDTVGAWQAGMAGSQNSTILSAGASWIKEGQQIVNAFGQYRAEVTGATSKPFAAMVATFKGA